MLAADKNIARMHIRMEEAVTENLGEKYLHTTLGQQFHVCALLMQSRNIRNRNTVDTLHDQHIFTAEIRINLRHIEHRAVFKITPQLNGISRFALQIQLIQQCFFILADDLFRPQTSAVR